MPSKTPWPDPFSGLASGFESGMKTGLMFRKQRQEEQESLAKAAAEKKKAQDDNDKAAIAQYTNVLSLPEVTDSDKTMIYGKLREVSNRLFGDGHLPDMEDGWNPDYNKTAKQINKLYNNPDLSPSDKLRFIKGVIAEASSQAQAKLKPILEQAQTESEQYNLAGASDIISRTRTNPDLVARTDPAILEYINSEQNRLLAGGGTVGQGMLSKGMEREGGKSKDAIATDTDDYVADKISSYINMTGKKPTPDMTAQWRLDFRRAQAGERQAGKAAEQSAEKSANRLEKLNEKADLALKSIEVLQIGRDLVNRGIYTGSAANIKLGFNKWLQEVGMNVNGQKATDTDTFASIMGKQVGQVIKDFGSGTGLSDADREYAEKIAGGKITLTEGAIRQLLDINERLSMWDITHYNKAVENYNKGIYFEPKSIPERRTTNTPSPQSGWGIQRID